MSTSSSRAKAFVVAAAFGMCALAASATPITYDFTVIALSGPLAGTTANGDLTFDNSSIPTTLPGANLATGLLIALDFTWDGITYNAGTANTGLLAFDGVGDLGHAEFGTDCIAGSCFPVPGTDNWFAGPSVGGSGNFVYDTPTGSGFGFSTMTQRSSVPEPATLALLGIGLAGLGFSRRKRKH